MLSARRQEFFAKSKIEKPVKKKKTLIQPRQMDFDIFFRSLLTRISGLSIYFGSGQEDMGQKVYERLKAYIDAAAVFENHLSIKHVRRYRRSNTRWIYLDGFTGDIVFDNVVPALLPWINAVKILQIGKFPAMGYGEVSISNVEY